MPRRGLAEAEGSPSALAEVYAFRAAILAALRLDDEALRVMTLVLALEPSFEPTDPLLTSPKITSSSPRTRRVRRADRQSQPRRPSPDERDRRGSARRRCRVANVRDPLEVVLLVRGEGSAAYRPIPFGLSRAGF